MNIFITHFIAVQDIDSDPGSDSEDETFGYIVKENLENGKLALSYVVN